MGETHIDHIYRETASWEAFIIAESWGAGSHRGAQLTLGNAVVVLAETSDSDRPANSVVFGTDELAALSNRIGRNIVVSHWGTSLISIEDPDGNRYTFERRNETE